MLVTFTEKYQIIFNEEKMNNFREMGLDGGMKKFIKNLRPMIILPPAVNDRPHIEYIRQANLIRGWGL